MDNDQTDKTMEMIWEGTSHMKWKLGLRNVVYGNNIAGAWMIGMGSWGISWGTLTQTAKCCHKSFCEHAFRKGFQKRQVFCILVYEGLFSGHVSHLVQCQCLGSETEWLMH